LTCQILEEEFSQGPGGVLHCFTAGFETAQRCLDLGFHISFGFSETLETVFMFSARANIPIRVPGSKFQIVGFARVPGSRFQFPGQVWNLQIEICLEFGI